MSRSPHILYDRLGDSDPEQIAQDHTDIMISDFNNGVLDKYLLDIEKCIDMPIKIKNDSVVIKTYKSNKS